MFWNPSLSQVMQLTIATFGEKLSLLHHRFQLFCRDFIQSLMVLVILFTRISHLSLIEIDQRCFCSLFLMSRNIWLSLVRDIQLLLEQENVFLFYLDCFMQLFLHGSSTLLSLIEFLFSFQKSLFFLFELFVFTLYILFTAFQSVIIFFHFAFIHSELNFLYFHELFH